MVQFSLYFIITFFWIISLRLDISIELFCLTNPARAIVLVEIFKSSFLLHMTFKEICRNLAEMPTLLSLIYTGQWDQILSSANLCSTSCSVSHTHGQKKKPPKKLPHDCILGINWKWFFASQMHSGLLKVLIWQMHQAYIVAYKASWVFLR